MQTFLPYPNMACSVAVLDRARLGKQRLECRQILGAIQNGGGWRNHPAVKMWRHHQRALMLYHDACIREWVRRGYKNEMLEFGLPLDTIEMPPWMGDPAFHAAHRASLLAKDSHHYAGLGWEEEPLVGYRWPEMQSATEYRLTDLR
jgi:hypothetical protein